MSKETKLLIDHGSRLLGGLIGSLISSAFFYAFDPDGWLTKTTFLLGASVTVAAVWFYLTFAVWRFNRQLHGVFLFIMLVVTFWLPVPENAPGIEIAYWVGYALCVAPFIYLAIPKESK